jgi:hypothetical protein
MSRCVTASRGVALLVVLMAMSMLMALGLALTAITMGESAVAAGYGQGTQAFHAAESACEFALQALARESDWQGVVDGVRLSSLTDAAVLGILAADDPPQGALYAYGWLADLFPSGTSVPPLAIAAWVFPDAAGTGLVITGRAYGTNGSRREIEMRVARPQPPHERLRVVSWREVR